MPILYALGKELVFQQANLPLGMQTALSSLFLIAAALLTIYLVLVRFPRVMRFLQQALQDTFAFFSGQKREARLNKVVCYHCHKGMGLYNPTYFMFQGEPHIEGTCNLCGGNVRVRLN
jgi:hypothetical protein